jgi:hypothetical protein
MSFKRSPFLIGCPCLRSKVRTCRSTDTTTPSRGGNMESIWLTTRSRLAEETPKTGAVPTNQNTHASANDRLFFFIYLCTRSIEIFGLFEQLYGDLGPLRHFGQLEGKDEQSVRIDGRLEDPGTLLLGRFDRTCTVFPLDVGT